MVETRADSRTPYKTVAAGPYASGAGRRDSKGLNKVLREDGTGGDLAKLQTTTLGWKPSCGCIGADTFAPRPGRVLDPFAGSGRCGVQAQRLGLDFTGVELSPEYARMAERLLYEAAPLFQE